MVKALFVDDNATFCRFTAVTLSHALPELEILIASTMTEAMSLLCDQTIDVLIVDRHLVDGDGLALMASVRKKSPHCVSIVISAEPLGYWAEEARAQGADATLEKPFDTTELAKLIDQMLHRNPLHS